MKPGLFIIGGPKTGTTALCTYLAAHPEVCFSEPKEPKYFHKDFAPAHRFAMSEEEYLRCFDVDPSRHRLLAEGTVWYLSSRCAVQSILRFNPAARFVVMIRNPVRLAHSLHSQLLYGGDEEVRDFEAAWRLQKDRREGRELPRGSRDRKALLYGDVAKCGAQIERLFSEAPREQVLVINHDAFSSDPDTEYRRVLEFADLSPDHRSDFDRVNENKHLRQNPLTKVAMILRRLKLKLGLKRSFGIWRAMQPMVAQTGQREPLSPAFEQELYDFFLEDVELTERLLGADLSAWKQPSIAKGKNTLHTEDTIK